MDRNFRNTGFGALLFVLVVASGACQPDGGLSQEEVFAASQAVARKLNSLPGLDLDSDNAELVAFIRSRPEFSEAGISPDFTVWARFTDGLPLVVMTTRRTPEIQEGQAPLTGELGSALGTLPADDTARVVNVLNLAPTAAAFAHSALSSSGYDSRLLGGSLEDFRKLKGLSVLYLSTHGGTAKVSDELFSYAFGTAERLTQSSCGDEDSVCKANWEERRYGILAVAVYRDGGDPYWAVTPEFVRKYWSFKANSIAFLDACSSADQDDMRAALQQAGAGTFLGWNGLVDAAFADRTASYLFDRVLGANSFEAVTPKQRPFSVPAVLLSMRSQGRHQDHGVYKGKPHTSTLWLEQSGDDALLVPSIKTMTVDEVNDTLVIEGDFGTEPGEVTVGGHPRPVSSWDASEIEIALPPSGPGSFGDVVVKVRTHESNAAPLTDWRGTFSHRREFISTVAPGTFHDVDCTVMHFRGDLHPYRELPDSAPILPMMSISDATRDSTCTYSLSGTGTKNNTTYTLSGSGTLPWSSQTNTVEWPNPWFHTMGWISSADRKLTFVVNFSGPGEVKAVTSGGSSMTSQFATVPTILEMLGMPRTLENDFSLPQTNVIVPAQGDSATIKLKLDVQAAPGPDTAA